MTDEEVIKNYGNYSNIGFILKVDIEYPEELRDLHSDLPFLPERTKINKCNKLVCTLYDKKDNVVHIRNLKHALEHGLKLKKYCLLNDAIIFKSQQRLKSEAHNLCTEEVNKIALSSNDDKRLLAYDGVTACPYGYKYCKSMQNKDAKQM